MKSRTRSKRPLSRRNRRNQSRPQPEQELQRLCPTAARSCITSRTEGQTKTKGTGNLLLSARFTLVEHSPLFLGCVVFFQIKGSRIHAVAQASWARSVGK